MSTELPSRFARCLTRKRIGAQAFTLLICLWSAAILDFATAGPLDRIGNVKFQDFVQFYVGGAMVRLGQTALLYDGHTALAMIHQIVPRPDFELPMVYGPQVEAFFAPLSRFSFPVATALWVLISIGIYLGCCSLIWKSCPALAREGRLFWLLALAYPPFFHIVIGGQISAVTLACFTGAYFAFRANRSFLAGLALGSMVFKPQFLVAIPFVLLFALAWRALVGTVVGAVGQLALTWAWCGTEVMRQYIHVLSNFSRLVSNTEVGNVHAQMHSLRGFFSLLLPWPPLAFALTLSTSVAAIVLAAHTWRNAAPLALRFSSLALAAVLVNPHLFGFDLLVLAPVLILLGNWLLSDAPQANAMERDQLACALYGAYALPLLAPLTLITHVQLSVLAMAWLQWVLWRESSRAEVPRYLHVEQAQPR